ncbi:L,D-transpeptidase [Methylacidiphilum caldifontis]|uniref:L,D-transpeptidase n=1 Tax=Methylacidiphilum caldifontis TaxID=2795386 RepID=UPI001A908CB8|nr:L,D-transpeptidase [Methylacidiphilum caldifontis]QSR88867.1 L,D-transpeptidase [Methylacidiphilum caldifontis]
MKKILQILLFLSSCLHFNISLKAISFDDFLDFFEKDNKNNYNKGVISVKVSLNNQALYVLEGNKVILASHVCTGKRDSTPTGYFKVLDKQMHKRSSSYGFWVKEGKYIPSDVSGCPGPGWRYVGYPMPYAVEFSPGYYIHQGYVWPVPRSHGCIRLEWKEAERFYKLVDRGTPISIKKTQPEDKKAGKRLKQPKSYKKPDPSPSLLVSERAFNPY